MKTMFIFISFMLIACLSSCQAQGQQLELVQIQSNESLQDIEVRKLVKRHSIASTPIYIHNDITDILDRDSFADKVKVLDNWKTHRVNKS